MAGSAAGGRWAAGGWWGSRGGLGGAGGGFVQSKGLTLELGLPGRPGSAPVALTASGGQLCGPGMPASGPDHGCKARRVIGMPRWALGPRSRVDGPMQGHHLSRAALCTKTTQSPSQEQRLELRGIRCKATMAWVLGWARA